MFRLGTFDGWSVCEDGITEPYGDNPDLFFYEWGTVDPWERIPSLEELSTDDIYNGTFAGDINNWLEQTLAEHPDWTIGDPYTNDTSNYTDTTDATTSQKMITEDKSVITGLVPDAIKRGFHPTLNGHALIADLVFYYMDAERADMLSLGVQPSVAYVMLTTCALSIPSSTSTSPTELNCTKTGSWMTKEVGHEIRNTFCSFYISDGGKGAVDISGVTDQASAVKEVYPLWIQANTGNVTAWLINPGGQGCDSGATIMPSADDCIAMLDAILDDCKCGCYPQPYPSLH